MLSAPFTDEVLYCRTPTWTRYCSTRALCVEVLYAANEVPFCKLSSLSQLVSASQFSFCFAYIAYSAYNYTVRSTSPSGLSQNKVCYGIYPEHIEAFAWMIAFALRLLFAFFSLNPRSPRFGLEEECIDLVY
jgi:hypothetical protein